MKSYSLALHRSCLTSLAAGLLWFATLPSWGAEPIPQLTLNPPSSDSNEFEQLGQIKVTTVLRTESTVQQTAAAITVITQEDIRRSGATSIPELLRMVPGMEVVRGIENGGWLVSARGFNSVPNSKMLMLVDGRSVYSPVSSAVFWDVQDTMLEDIERVEVVRGPGGSLWGANAVNGIINVVTKNAKDTQGFLVTGGGGSYERDFGSARYGWKVGEDAYARVYVKHYDRDELSSTNGIGTGDPWHMTQGGLRADWRTADNNRFTLQGDVYGGDRLNPALTPSRVDLFGANVLGRWIHEMANDGELQLQAYYDRTDRLTPTVFSGSSDTADVDFQYHFPVGNRQHITLGLGYRAVWNQIDKTPTLVATSATPNTSLYNAFAQDEIELVKARLKLTLGSKFEHNDFTGLEFQPSARLLWTIAPHQSAWAAVSRAVRTPTVNENDSTLKRGPISTFGTNTFESEEVVAYELGYRVQPVSWLALDIATYYNQYSHLASIEKTSATTQFRENKLQGETYGAEVGATWKPVTDFTLHAAYSYMREYLRAEPGSTDTTSPKNEGNDPQQQIYLRGSLNLPAHLQFDGIMRYVDRLTNLNVPSYVAVDARLAWRPTSRFEIALVGQNIFASEHLEYRGAPPVKEIPRGGYGKVTWTF